MVPVCLDAIIFNLSINPCLSVVIKQSLSPVFLHQIWFVISKFIHAYPRLLELTPGPNRVPAPSQPNCYGGRVPLPASPPLRNPHPPFSAGQGRIQTPGKRRSAFSKRDAGSRRHSLSARACLFLRGARKQAGQSLLFWHLETGLSVQGWRVWKAIFYLLNVVSLHRAHVNCWSRGLPTGASRARPEKTKGGGENTRVTMETESSLHRRIQTQTARAQGVRVSPRGPGTFNPVHRMHLRGGGQVPTMGRHRPKDRQSPTVSQVWRVWTNLMLQTKGL